MPRDPPQRIGLVRTHRVPDRKFNSFAEAARTRPGMYVGDIGTYGLHHLVYFLLDEAYLEARGGGCGEVTVALEADGGVSVFDSAPVPRPEWLVRGVSDERFLKDSTYRPRSLAVACALSSRFQIELWEGGHHWFLRGERGLPSGEVQEVLPAAPVPEGAARGVRVSFLPDPSIFEVAAFNPVRLERRCRELAFLVPGLRTRFSCPAEGEGHVMEYPGGLGQRVEELTEGMQRLHPTPLVFDLRTEDLRVRCALQWCAAEGSVLSFANTVRTRKHGVHVDGLFVALRSAVAAVEGRPTRKLGREHLERGLTAIVAVDGPEDQMRFAGPTKALLDIPDLRKAVSRQLRHPLRHALAEHPAVTRFIVA